MYPRVLLQKKETSPASSVCVVGRGQGKLRPKLKQRKQLCSDRKDPWPENQKAAKQVRTHYVE